MKKILSRPALVAVVLFVALQLIPVSRPNPTVAPERSVYAALAVPADVKAVLDRSCRDCHTNETSWPSYAYVAPISWLVARHVKEGRSELNLSDWAAYDRAKATKKLFEICEEVREGKMPLRPYLLTHEKAKLSRQEIDTLCAWTAAARGEAAEL